MRIVPSRDVSPREVADTNLSQPALSGYTEPLHSSRFHVVHPTQSGQTTPRRVRPTRTRGSLEDGVTGLHTQSRQRNIFSTLTKSGEILKKNNIETTWK